MKLRYLTMGGSTQFPQAGSNRIKLTCKGLRAHGIDAIICEISSTFLNKKYLHYFGHLICLLKTILILNSSKKDDIIIIYGEISYYFILKFFQKRTKLFIEKHEYSAYLLYKTMTNKAINKSKNFEYSLRYFEGFITCSDELKLYYQSFTNPNCIYLVIPLILDFKKFSNGTFKKENYIGYCGDFGNNKDGIPALIDAFSIISGKFPQYKLFLAGGTEDNKAMKKLYNLVSKLNLKDRIVFTGVLNHDEMPEFLGKASVLALARPQNLQAKGGFPSKIAEYLATGKPVAVTRVGELDKYLSDEKNVFFSKSDKEEDFAECLDKILSNESFSNIVGEAGKIVAQSFDYIDQTKIIIEHFKINP